MFVREFVQRCPTCAEVTPHSRRRLALPRIVALLLVGLTLWCALEGGAWWPAAVATGFAAAFVGLRDRERYWHVACERCRGYRVAEVRASNPRFGSTTIFDPF